ncbi:MAG: UDP-N-acetylmuramate--L-alanine ligase [Gammaproteobacteria bacterium]|nr:MAG: UDP-N-acetylmuramate--L-alanine ligase [Gammaproteobacteria bacterium]
MTSLPETPRYAAEAMGRMRRLHFVGIGGAGMNGIAQVMLNLGYRVSGSDMRANAATRRLAEQGAEVHIGHAPEHVRDADAVIISSAVTEDNPEVMAARTRRIPVVPRAEMLAEIMRFRYGIAVAGTHGKTTTTSLIASLLIDGGLDPTYVIGGRLNAAGSHAHLGEGEILVAEADESDASFLYLQPMLAVVTNVDEDHMATYGGEFERLRAAFLEFLHHLPFYGVAVLCIDDANARGLLPDVTRRVITYGFSEDADVRGEGLSQAARLTRFTTCLPNGERMSVELTMPGRHNALNALAAIAVGHELGLSTATMQQALARFQGIGRRFQMHECRLGGRNVILVDDYGHHPRELEATLSAVRAGWPERRLVLAFQPHRYSRTRDAFDDFARVLNEPDVLVLSEVFAAGEAPIAGADGRALARAVRARGKIEPVFVETIDELPQVLEGLVKDGDIVLVMGAGSIGQVAARLGEGECQ